MDLIVAVNQMQTIGYKGDIPWSCSADLKFFKKVTLDKKCLVGRKTYESLPPLKRREFVIVGKNHYSLEEALEQNPEVCIGGQQIYESCLRLGVIDRMLISHIQDWTIGDTFFRIPKEVIDSWELFKLSKGKKGLKMPEIKHYYLSCEEDVIMDENLNVIQ